MLSFEEDIILRWERQAIDGGETTYVAWCDKFLTWLKEAEEEDSDDSDD